jgi:hypothetical protein
LRIPLTARQMHRDAPLHQSLLVCWGCSRQSHPSLTAQIDPDMCRGEHFRVSEAMPRAGYCRGAYDQRVAPLRLVGRDRPLRVGAKTSAVSIMSALVRPKSPRVPGQYQAQSPARRATAVAVNLRSPLTTCCGRSAPGCHGSRHLTVSFAVRGQNTSSIKPPFRDRGPYDTIRPAWHPLTSRHKHSQEGIAMHMLHISASPEEPIAGATPIAGGSPVAGQPSGA